MVVVFWVLAPPSCCLGDQTASVLVQGVIMEVLYSSELVSGKNVNHVAVFGINIYISTVLIGNYC